MKVTKRITNLKQRLVGAKKNKTNEIIRRIKRLEDLRKNKHLEKESNEN